MNDAKKPSKPDTPIEAADQSEESLALSQYAGALGFGEGDALPTHATDADPRSIVLQPGIQALWNAVLPVLGVRPSRAGEYPGLFKVEHGPGKGEATIFLDIPDQPYSAGEPSAMDRVVALRVKLDHDYRLLGGRYYCIGCEPPDSEMQH